MRSIVSGLCTVLAMICVIVAVPGLWASQKVVSADGFSTSAAQAARDPQVQQYFASTISETVTDQTSIPLAGDIVAPLAKAYTSSPQFVADFTEVARQQHEWLFTAPGPDVDTHVMDLNITPMINNVIASANLPIPVTVERPLYIAIDQHRLTAGSLESTGDLVNTIAWGGLIGAIVLGLLALATANRRGTVLAWLGVGTMLAAAAAFGVAKYIESVADDASTDSQESARHTIDAVVGSVSSDLTTWAVITVIVGALVTVAGVLLGIVGGGRRRGV